MTSLIDAADRNARRREVLAHQRRPQQHRGSKLADLVLVDGDPTTSVGDVRKVALVITQGHLISPTALYQTLGMTPFVQDEPVLRAVGAPASSAAGVSGSGGSQHFHGAVEGRPH